MIWLLSFLLIFALSCGVKTTGVCLSPQKVAEDYTLNHVPREFRIYGKFRYGPVSFPMMIAKFDGFYTVKVAKVKDVSLERDRICARGKCYLLPLLPEDIIFGKVLTGSEYSFCRKGLLYFRERLGLYEKIAVFDGRDLRELVIVNRKRNRAMKITFGEFSGKGYFREITFIMDGEEVKLEIEEVEI